MIKVKMIKYNQPEVYSKPSLHYSLLQVRQADKNGDGAVDRQEFIDIMMRTNLFL